MLKNYLKTAFLNLWRHWGFSLINILGLVVGITASFLIFLYVRFEKSYDGFNRKADRIYRLTCTIRTTSGSTNTYQTSAPMAINLAMDFPGIESEVRMLPNSILITKDDVKFQENLTMFADSSLFSIFDYQLLEGDPHTVLKDPFSIVMSQSTAKKYFGQADPIGQLVEMTGLKMPARVTGIMKDIPENSQIKADLFISSSTIFNNWDTTANSNWRNLSYISYLLLKPGTDPAKLQGEFPSFLQRHIGGEMKSAQQSYSLYLEPLRKIYLRSKFGGPVTGNAGYVSIFLLAAIFILVIACINFVNLSTARAVERAKEVGIRKTMGAVRIQLILQFLGESVLLCLIAFMFSVILSSALLPLFNELAGKPVSMGIFSNRNNLPILLFTSLLAGFVAGIYPALVLSAYRPVLVLKGRFVSSKKGLLLRKGLVISQFAVSLLLIIGTIIVYAQLHYMSSRDLGFSKAQTLIIATNGDAKIPAFKNEVSSLNHVVSLTSSTDVPGSGDFVTLTQIQNSAGDMQTADLGLYNVDFNYIGLYNIPVVAGRSFSKDFQTDSAQAIILNEMAVRAFGYSSPEQVIGKRFVQGSFNGTVIGVVKDFHFSSLKQKIGPLSIRIRGGILPYISIRLTTNDLPETIAAIEKIWKQLIPTRPFNYFFLDEFFDRQYHSEVKFGSLFLNFAILAIFISCLGLFALASYITLQRTKEIGIRKIIGSSVSGIVVLLSKDFLKLVAISIVIASPIAWIAMNYWLNDFAYRIEILWWMIAVAGMCSLLIALVTVSLQAIRAAVANPVNSLRSE